MANPYAGVYFGFKIWETLLRTRLYAVNTAPTINVCVDDMVGADTAMMSTPKLGLTYYLQDGAVLSSSPGDEFMLIGSVQACFDENMDPIQYIAAARAGDATVAGYVLVADHPDQQFMAVVNAAITAADADLNYSFAGSSLAAPNTYTKISAQYITTTGAANTVTIPLRLIGQSHPQEDSYALAGCRMICQIQPFCHLYGISVPL